MKTKIEHIELIDRLKKSGLNWNEVYEYFKANIEDFNNTSSDGLRKLYYRYKNLLTTDIKEIEQTSELDAIKTSYRNKLANTKTNRNNLLLTRELLEQDQMLAAIELLVSQMKNVKVPNWNLKQNKSLKTKIWNVLLSDLHNGKIIKRFDEHNNTTEIFNNKIFSLRMKELTRVLIIKLKQDAVFFNTEKIMVSMLGDFIENSLMHGIESMAGSEYQNSEQIMECIKSIFTDFILPISALNIPLEFNCVTGNHDRISEHKTYSSPGKTNSTWIIYNTLKMMCDNLKLNTKWNIATDNFMIVKVFNCNMLLEHGDEFKGLTENSFKIQTQKRENQIGKKIDFTRIGHFHSPVVFGLGKFICNGSLPGQDDYALNRGYETVAGQFIESFLNCGTARNNYYENFYIQLDHILGDKNE